MLMKAGSASSHASEVIRKIGGRSNGETGLADAAGADEGGKSNVVAADEGDDGGGILLTTNE
jgi:hypothetical protein